MGITKDGNGSLQVAKFCRVSRKRDPGCLQDGKCFDGNGRKDRNS